MRFYLWAVADAKSPEQVIARLGDIIKSEFVGFNPTGIKPVTLPGAKATQVFGTGKEADDGDPGLAEVVVFSVGGHVFVACVHGESIADWNRDFMMAALKTISTP